LDRFEALGFDHSSRPAGQRRLLMNANPWNLIAPDLASMDTIWRSPLPFALWPVCEKPLLSYWLDEAVRRGVPSVRIQAMDRPHLIRAWLDQRDLWSRTVEVKTTQGTDGEYESIEMDRLPSQPEAGKIESPMDLLGRWLELQHEAIRCRTTGMVHLDQELQPGVWVGPGVRISGDVTLSAPCWIGSYAQIGANCHLGPGAFVGAGSFVDEDVEIENSIVCADTYIGSHTSLKNMAAQGGLLLDFKKGVAVEVSDSFVMGPTIGDAPSVISRAVAMILGPVLCGLARVAARGRPADEVRVRIGRDREVVLKSYPRGPLCLRRAGWVCQVAAGTMRWVGVLPRTPSDWDSLPAEVRSALERAPVGVFALSDLYHCHSPSEPDEWTHALFQAGAANRAGNKLVWNSLIKTALTTPAES